MSAIARTVDVAPDRDLLPRYARVTDRWLGLASVGIDTGIHTGGDGALRLRSLPDAGVAAGPRLSGSGAAAPAGVALDPNGSGWVSDPTTGRVLIMTNCLPVIAAPGDILATRPGDTELLPGAFTTPRGLLLGPRRRLYVADAGANSVIVVDPISGAITGTWASVTEPWCLGTDGTGVYVLDRGGAAGQGRVQRFDADGVADTGFATAVAGVLSDPIRLAVSAELLYVVDRRLSGDRVVPLTMAGLPAPTAPAWAAPTATMRIGGIATGCGEVYLVDADQHDLHTVDADAGYVGRTRPAAPITDVFGSDPLWSCPAEAGTLLRHDPSGARVRSGQFVCGPLDTATVSGRREVRARADRSAGTHLQLWTVAMPGLVAPALGSLPGLDPSVPPAPGLPAWSALPPDVDVALASEPTGPYLWLGGRLSGDGAATPAVHQLAVSGSRGWLDLLPAIYRKDHAQSDFADRLLRLLHSVQEETSAETLALARRFDAWTADDRSGPGGALDVLAGWLDLTLDERWTEPTRRGVVGAAFVAQGLRGTPAGLAAAIRARFDAAAAITEPAQWASIWSLSDTVADRAGCASCGDGGRPAIGLGFDTMLVAGPPDGAVVGASAVVGQSSLTAGTSSGGPLFSDLAHRFHVSVRADEIDRAGGEPALRAVIEQEKPAHTVYTLCLVGPRARVGVQARVGIDTILAGPPDPLDLDGQPGLDLAALGAVARHSSSTETVPAYLGQTRLGAGRLT